MMAILVAFGFGALIGFAAGYWRGMGHGQRWMLD
jgi:uncharacterized membrane protein (Fun14 family)